MQQKKGQEYYKNILTGLQYILALLVWVYIVYRAFFIEIIHDEAISYYLVKINYLKALAGTFNTHWLNSIFIKLVSLLPGQDEVWKLRLFSVFSWLPYVFCIIKIGGRLNNKFLGWLFFTACIFNPFLILYFSLARGYAPASALLLYSIWQAGKLTDLQEYRPQKWMSVFVPAALSLLSNFSVLYFFLALIAAYVFCLAYAGKWKLLTLKNSSSPGLVILFSVLFAGSSLLIIKFYSKEAEFEGGINLIDGLFTSQIKKAGYQFLPEGAYHIAGMMWFALFLLAFGLSCYWLYKEKQVTLLFLVTFISAGIILLNALFHLFLGTVYLSDRRALFSYCLLILSACFLFDRLGLSTGYKKTILSTLAAALSGIIMFNAYRNINTVYFTEWPVQNKTKEALDFLSAAKAKKIGLDLWQYSVAKNYYTLAFPKKYGFVLGKADGSIIANQRQNLDGYDYILLSEPPKEKSQTWTTVLYYPLYGTTVLKYTGK